MNAKHAQRTVRRSWVRVGTAALAVLLTFLLCTQTLSLPTIAVATEGASQQATQTEGTTDQGTQASDSATTNTAADESAAPVETDDASAAPADDATVSDGLATLQNGGSAPSEAENNLAGGSNSIGTAAPAEDPTVSVALDLSDQATVKYNDTEYTAETENIDAPAGEELAFTAAAAEGFQISAVKQIAAGVETELQADEATGEYKVAADAVAEGLTIKVETEAVVASDETAGEAVEGEQPAADADQPATGEEAVEGAAVADVLSADNGISAQDISGAKRVAVGGVIRLSSDSPAGSDGWFSQKYEHRWTAEPSDKVRISDGSNSGATVEGLSEGRVTITHTWGYYNLLGRWYPAGSETYTIEVVQADPDDLCTITFDVNGGTWNDPLNGTHAFYMGTELWPEGKDLSVPTRDGYVFEGWKPNVSRIVTNDATYTAQWKRVDNDLTPVYVYLQVKGDTTGLILNSSGWYTIGVIYMPRDLVPNSNLSQDQSVNLNIQRVERALNEAMGSIVRYGPNESLVVDEAEWTKLHVQSGANDYVPSGLAWHLDGTIDASYLANLTVNYIDQDTGETLKTETNLFKTGTRVNPSDYTNEEFKNYTFSKVEPADAFEIRKDQQNVINVYYTKNADFLSYDANGGEGAMEPTRGKAEEQVTVAGNGFTRTSYKFTGWNTEPEGTGKTYQPGDQYTLTDGNDVLYAQWEEKEGEFRYNLVLTDAAWAGSTPAGFTQDGKFWVDPVKYANPDEITVTNEVPACVDYTFLGWFDKDRGEGASIRPANSTFVFPEKYDSDTYTLDALWASIKAEPKTVTYDGDKHAVDAAEVLYNNNGLPEEDLADVQNLVSVESIQYSKSEDGGYSAAIPTWKDAGTYTVYIKATLNVGGQIVEIKDSTTLTIDPVELTVKANDASKTYDGTPLTDGGYEIVSGSFVGEEGFSSVTVEGAITDPGTAANKVTGWEFADGTIAGNYKVTAQDGTLTVSKVEAEIVITADSSHKTYDGTPLTDGGYTYTQDVLAEGDVLTAVVEGSATNVTDGKVANVVTSYKVMRGETDVTANYTFGESVAGELYIDPAPYTVTTNSASKVFDGSALTEPGITVSGIVEGETYGAAATGSQTEVGTSDNTYDLTFAGEGNEYTAKASNYALAENGETLGTLTVVPQSINPDDPKDPDPNDPDQPVYSGVEVNTPTDVPYNGTDQTWIPEVTDSKGNSVDPSNYDVTYSTDDRTNVTSVITVTITGKGNYGGTVTREYRITPREIVLTIDDQTKVAGTADPTFTSNYTGIVAGETAGWTGKFVRDAGEAVGTYTIHAGDMALADNPSTGFLASNYTLRVIEGTLAITAAPVTPPGGGDNPGGGTPDGTTPDTTPGGTATPTAVTDDGTAIEDDATPLANAGAETIDDEGTPLTSGAKAHVDCWVHWLMIIGLIVSAIYFGGVAIRRRTFSSQLQSFEDDVLGNNANNTTNA